MHKLLAHLKSGPLLFDGAMHTYQEQKDSYVVYQEYAAAGAQAIKTNTFLLSSQLSGQSDEGLEQIEIEVEKARSALPESIFLFADIGPCLPDQDTFSIYKKQVDRYLALSLDCFLFETMTDLNSLAKISSYIHEKKRDAFVLVSFAIDESGLSEQGFSMQFLYDSIVDEEIDGVGFNCRIGPKHMLEQIKKLARTNKPLFIAPNAGYPTILGWRVHYNGSAQYFAQTMKEIRLLGVEMLGGCCGTSPEHIRQLNKVLQELPALIPYPLPTFDKHRVQRPKKRWKHLIAIELDPPKNDQLETFMQGVQAFQEEGVDLITIADCPIGRPRADSSLLASKIKRETGLDPLPHITCRDRNLNAIKALLLGLSAENIHQVLFVTGDPLPKDSVEEIKAVYHFNSRKLIKSVSEMDVFSSPFSIFAALNLNAYNFSQQLRLAKEKEKNGAIGFLCQPIHSKEGLNNLKRAKEELNGLILAGIYPIVSYKNAQFLANEITGMLIDSQIIDLYQDKSREECEKISQEVSKKIMKECLPYCDGFYLMTPFQRIDLMRPLIQEAKRLLNQKEQSISS